MSVVLSEHLPLLATAPDGIQKLRGLILELAVRGKLVPQDPNDEPAIELLKRIAKERTRLEAEGACKKSKATSVCAEEQVFGSPSSWAWVRLTHFGEFRGGKTPSTNRSDYWDGSIPWVSPKDMKSLVVTQTEERVTDLAIADGLNPIPASSVLVVVRSGILRRMVPVAINAMECTVNQDLKALCLYMPNMAPYIQLLIRGFERLILETLTKVGTTVESIKFEEFSQQPFPLPPLAEQHRIVAKVDELMALCDRLDAEQADAGAAHARLVVTLLGTLTQSSDAAELAANWQRLAEHFDTLFTTESSLDALKQTILQLAVVGKLVPQDPNDEPVDAVLSRLATVGGNLKVRRGVPTEVPTPDAIADQQLPKSWHTLSVARLLNLGAILDLKDGNHGANHPKVAEFTEAGLPFITAAQVREDGSIDYDGAYKVSGKVLSRLRVGFSHSDDVIYTHKGSVGRVAIAIRDCVLTPQTTYYRTNRDFIASAYLAKFLRSKVFRDQVDSVKGQTTRDFVAISAQYEFFINLPPLAEQHRIAAKVDELMALVDRLKADLAESRAQQERLAATLIETALKAA